MYFRYQCKHWYKFENNEMERILSCKCCVLCYILEYSYIVQIAKRRTRPVFAFNMQNTIKHSTWSGICMLKANSGLVRLFAFLTLKTNLIFTELREGFHWAFATGEVCQQGTLTLPDTKFRPVFMTLIRVYWWNHIFPNLSWFSWLFHFGYPSVLSRFNSTSRYIDDKSAIDNPEFVKYITDIYQT